MQEASKVKERYGPMLLGHGIDIGCGDDPITPGCVAWDRAQGDAQTMGGQRPETYDWVFSSHCLEHMARPLEALLTWWRLLKPGGLMVVIVPDEDAYEQCIWPSIYNTDHKSTFTPSKWKSWSPASLNLTDLIAYLPDHKLLGIYVLDTRTEPRGDVTMQGGQAQIELVLKKELAPRPFLTPLAQTVTCAACGHSPTLVGITHEASLHLHCGYCGKVGTYVAK